MCYNFSVMKFSRRAFVGLGLAAASGACAEGPGTFFDPQKGTANVVSDAPAAAGAVTRTVAFLGGSITEMHGYRPRVMEMLRKRYPGVAFKEIAAGLSSTCSDAAAFRFAEDVLAQGTPDLLFVEEAVNDDQDGHFDRRHMILGLEGVIRQAYQANPSCRIVVGLLPNHAQFQQLAQGREPLAYRVHGEIARHYGLAVADVTAALVKSAASGGFGWGQYRDCHPSPDGCDFAAKVIFAAICDGYDPAARPQPRPVPAPMEAASLVHPGTVAPAQVALGADWRHTAPDWAKVPGSKRGYFTIGPAYWTETATSELTVNFTGTALAAFLTAGPDCGDLVVAVDGGTPRTLRLRADYGSLHYPYVQFLAEGLQPGAHRAVLKAQSRPHGAVTGCAIRLHRLYFN